MDTSENHDDEGAFVHKTSLLFFKNQTSDKVF